MESENMESIRVFKVYVDQMYQNMKPYSKCLNLTLVSWRYYGDK